MRIVYGLGPLYIVKSDGTTLTLARDGTTSVRAEVSDAGATTRSFRYAAYGRLAQAPNGAPWFLGFAGEFSDPSGLTYLRARWYDPATARFVTADAKVDEDHPPLSRFAHARGNPLSRLDPSGSIDDPADPVGGGVGGWGPVAAAGASVWIQKFFSWLGSLVGARTPPKPMTREEAADVLRVADRVGSALKTDPYHRAPNWVVDEVATNGTVNEILGGDGVARTLVQLPGQVNGRKGMFEWIIDETGKVAHEFFREGGSVP